MKILNKLGQGTMGEVYLAESAGRRLALKFLHLHADDNLLAYFKSEVQVLAQISYPNLVRIYDFFDAKAASALFPFADSLPSDFPRGAPFFSMEYLEGCTLEESPQRPEIFTALSLFFQACEGLQYLHARHILHRDLKPSNLWINSTNTLKILDFGLALRLDESQQESAIVGTWRYSPPEAYDGKWEPRSDLFSLGVIFYEWLTGRKAFSVPLTHRGLEGVVPPASVKKLRPDLPVFFGDLLDRLIQLNPSLRPSSAQVLLSVLQEHGVHGEKQAESLLTVLEKPPLIGRDEELLILKGYAEALREKRRAFTLVTLEGPIGVGRSRLLEEWRWDCLLRGLRILDLNYREGPFWLDQLWKKLRTTQEEFPQGLPEQLEVLQALLGSEPTALVLRDLQAWPAETFPQLRILLEKLRRGDSPLLVVLEQAEGPVTWVEAAQRRLQLADLEQSQALRMIAEATSGWELPEATAKSLAVRSGGRPLLIIEGLKQLALSDFVSSKNLDLLGIPENLRQSCAQGLKRLSTEARALLALLLCHPSLSTWESLPESKHRSPSSLLELDLAGILKPRSPEEPQLFLAHPSLQEAYLSALSEEERLDAHRWWLESLRNNIRGGAADETTYLDLMEHARALGDLECTAAFGMKSLEILEGRGDLNEALSLSDRLLGLAIPAAERLRLHAHRAPLYYKLGRYPEAIAAYGDFYREKPETESLRQKVKFLYYTGLVHFSAGEDREAEAGLLACLATSSAEKFADIRGYHARAHQLLGNLSIKRAAWREGASHFERAKDLAAGDEVLLGEIAQGLGKIAQEEIRWEDAEKLFLSARDHFQSAEAPQAEALDWQALAQLQRAKGDLRQAEASSLRSLALANAGAEILQWARYHSNHALLLTDLGRYFEALGFFRKTVEILEILGNPEDVLIAHLQELHFLSVFGNQDRWDVAFASLLSERRALENFQLWGFALFLEAEELYRRGEWAKAEEVCRGSLSELPPAERPKAHWAWLRCRSMRALLSGEDPRIGEVKKQLGRVSSSFFSLCIAVVEFLSGSPESLTREALEELKSRIDGAEGPENRIQFYQLLGQYLHAQNLETLASRMRQKADLEWRNIDLQLPEEYRMDFEKNRNLRDFNATLEQAKPVPVAGEKPASITEARFRQFCAINRQISQKTDFKEILERVMDVAIEWSGAERGFLILKKGKEKLGPLSGYKVQTARNLNQKSLGEKEFQFSFSAIKEAIQQGGTLLTDNAQTDERFHGASSIHKFQLKSIMVIPLENDGENLGALYLDHRYQPGCFSSEDILMISGFAGQATMAIQKARTLEELRRAKEQLEIRVKDQGVKLEEMAEELSQSRQGLKFEYDDIIGRSPAMIQVFQLLDHVTQTKIPVWIWGESGTGKELVARSLHFNSQRKKGPFVAENCSAIPENLLESEFFGHKKGAFTHADRDRVGLFEQASGGSLFLDEVADMPLSMQAKLLRALQEEEIRPLGSNKVVKIDVRLI
ncbi:MAG: sigma 54-interacting transcriptional regulator, partial [Deltaproteobacteria bacterium]|nr:sigma 54-interacting transcriptional regulator [Deltaproteobacteria bacterium]